MREASASQAWSALYEDGAAKTGAARAATASRMGAHVKTATSCREAPHNLPQVEVLNIHILIRSSFSLAPQQ